MAINVKSNRINFNIRHQISAVSKINLGLEVLKKLSDGYHQILSYLIPIDFGDEFDFVFSSQVGFSLDYKSELSLKYEEQLKEVFVENLYNNLLYKTYIWLCSFTQSVDFWNQHNISKSEIPDAMYQWGIHIQIVKKVPSPCGLGGGSGDVACLLEAFLYFCSHFFSKQTISEIKHTLFFRAHELGTDIPLLFLRSQGILNGKYECTPLRKIAKYIGILGIPLELCPTKEMYAHIDSAHFFQMESKEQKIINDMNDLEHFFVSGNSELIDNYFVKGRQNIHNHFLEVLERVQPELYRCILKYYAILLDTTIDEFLKYFHEEKSWKRTNELYKRIEHCCFLSLSGSGGAFYLCIPISIFQTSFSLISIDCLSLILSNVLHTLFDGENFCHWEIFRSIE